jgi:hypothetical protein
MRGSGGARQVCIVRVADARQAQNAHCCNAPATVENGIATSAAVPSGNRCKRPKSLAFQRHSGHNSVTLDGLLKHNDVCLP